VDLRVAWAAVEEHSTACLELQPDAGCLSRTKLAREVVEALEEGVKTEKLSVNALFAALHWEHAEEVLRKYGQRWYVLPVAGSEAIILY
jgi:hypothetical protein